MASENATTLAIPFQYPESPELRTFRLVLYGLIIVASLLGNAVVIHSIIAIPYRKPLIYHLVTNLAAAELLGSLLLPLIQVYEEIQTWPFGNLLCHLVMPGQVTAGLVVTWTLAIISIHRYRTLMNHRTSSTASNLTPLLMGSLWIASVIVSLPSYLYSTVVKSPYDTFSHWCIVIYPGENFNDYPSKAYKTFLLIRFVINYVIPVVIMVLAYGSIRVKLKYHMARTSQTINSEISMQRMAVKESGDPESCDPAVQSVRESPRGVNNRVGKTTIGILNSQVSKRRTSASRRRVVPLELEQDLLKMIYVVVLVFVVCYFPYQIFFLLEYFQILSFKTWEHFTIARKYIFLITCLPSALHPLCYGTMTTFYGKAFSAIFLCKHSFGNMASCPCPLSSSLRLRNISEARENTCS